MLKMAAMGATLVLAISASAHASSRIAGVIDTGNAISKVGEGCGAGAWRDHNGACHAFSGPGGSNRGTRYECPPYTHIGEGGERCWPNR